MRKRREKKTPEMVITPQTKLAELLEAYPHLEQVLMELSPAFRRLQNPILRRTVARISTLQQVATVGGIKTHELVNILRRAVGQEEWKEETSDVNYATRPLWFDEKKVTKSLDARPLIEQGEHPLNHVLKDLADFQSDEIYELITPFVPAPLIDTVKNKGFHVWIKMKSPELIYIYIQRAQKI